MHKGCKLSPETHGHAKETNIGDENCSDRKANKTKRIHSLILHLVLLILPSFSVTVI